MKKLILICSIVLSVFTMNCFANTPISVPVTLDKRLIEVVNKSKIQTLAYQGIGVSYGNAVNGNGFINLDLLNPNVEQTNGFYLMVVPPKGVAYQVAEIDYYLSGSDYKKPIIAGISVSDNSPINVSSSDNHKLVIHDKE